MRRPFPRLAAACAFAIAMTFTGSALAGPGQGSDTAPGQLKQQQSTTSTQSSAQTGPGVKPDSTTTHWTHCTTGGTPAATTCTSSDNGHTPQPNADASKKYGNGKTAAQIAVSRGGTDVQLTGPGNSQPHKVTACGKPGNKSGGVDVHAVKSYLSADCAQAPTQVAATAQAATVAPATQQAAIAPVTSTPSPVVQVSPATQSSIAAPTPATLGAGAVLGVQKTLASPKPARGGVLGTVTNVAGSSLPFTGFPIWFAVVIALALVLAGLALRRRGAVTQL
jgi:hypothetical protein